ncbi:MAG TPA: class I SAM-dependent methyltransferase [Pseudonocardia sp.]|nr:class I SAM-dependent methyltransferase [Pseudonocardia sp.]
MAEDDAPRWDGRHAAAPHAGPNPPDAVANRSDLLPATGSALEVAAGRGAVAVWLALRGLRVDAVDVSATGLAAISELAREHGVVGRIRTYRHDLDAGLPGECAGPYDVVVCQRFRDPRLYPELARVLAPGGILVLTVLSEVGGRPGPFRAAAGELAEAFGWLDVLAHREDGGEAHLLARRPG